MELTEDQKRIHDIIVDFSKSDDDLMTFGGWAGCGKTTTIAHTARTLKEEGTALAFCALGGKASNVLRSKLNGTLRDEDYCGTIHKLIYDFRGMRTLNSGKEAMIFERKEDLDLDHSIIILDEASMVNRVVFEDLSALGIKILAVGDHGQLPPVPHYTMPNDTFNLMEEPDVKLEKIIRQAEGNPIIEISRIVRETGRIPKWNDPQAICLHDQNLSKKENYLDPQSVIISGRNSTRVNINRYAREMHGFNPDLPVDGDLVICLANNYNKWIFNGDIGAVRNVKRVSDRLINFDFEVYGRSVNVNSVIAQFNNEKRVTDSDYKTEELFDYAYAITCHKFQGSEANEVIVRDEPVGNTEESRRRWRYTAVTRAKQRLKVVLNK